MREALVKTAIAELGLIDSPARESYGDWSLALIGAYLERSPTLDGPI
jgi:hypothetical protein